MLSPRLALKEQILDCRRCTLCDVGSGPVPFSGPTPSYVAVVGEAPGQSEDAGGRPFIGPSGQLLRRCLEEAGFNVDQLFIANAVSCFPNRTPTGPEVNACSDNLRDQLELAGATWVLLLGGIALSTLRTDCKVSRSRGHAFLTEGDRKWFSTFHPSYALRQAKAEARMKADLAIFRQMVTAENWVELTSDECLGCGTTPEVLGDHEEGLRFDDMGGPWCELCWHKQAAQGKAMVKAVAKNERFQIRTGALFDEKGL